MRPAISQVFAEVLGVEEAVVTDDFSPATAPVWDSLQSMNLVIALEDAYAVKFSTPEITRMRSVGLVREVLRSKGVEVA
jgi:acyl carrier protein